MLSSVMLSFFLSFSVDLGSTIAGYICYQFIFVVYFGVVFFHAVAVNDKADKVSFLLSKGISQVK